MAVLHGDFERSTAAYAEAVGSGYIVLVSHETVLESQASSPGRGIGRAVLLR